MIPKKCFFTKGVGVHKEKLASFELALRMAGLAYCNLVLVSSIFPPGCKRLSKEEGTKLLRPGEIVFCVYDRESTNEPNRLVAASVGVAIPSDDSQYGYHSEYHSFGETDEKAGEYAEDLAASMLATTLGIEFDPDTAWDVRQDRAYLQYYPIGHRQQGWSLDNCLLSVRFYQRRLPGPVNQNQ